MFALSVAEIDRRFFEVRVIGLRGSTRVHGTPLDGHFAFRGADT
jgi:hypothetical protein